VSTDRADELLRVTRDSGMTQLITEPTGVTVSTTTIIDLIFVTNLAKIVTSGVIPMGISDHDCIYCICKPQTQTLPPKTINARSWKKFDENGFKIDCEHYPWEIMLCCNDVNTAWKAFKAFLTSIIDKHVPCKQIRVRGTKIPYMTDELREAMYNRDALLRRHRRTRSNEDWCLYKTQRNYTKKLLNQTKKDYYTGIVTGNKNDLWTGLKTMLPKHVKENPTSVKTGDTDISDKKGIANVFNKFFTTIGANLAKKLKTSHANEPLPNIVKPTCITQFKFDPVDVLDVHKALCMLNIGKATGLDNIPARILKVAATELAHPLATIFNFSLLTGQIPDEWKSAKVSALHKDGDVQDPTNYRPISVIPIVMKVFERSVHRQLYKYVSDNNYLNEFQSGFRPKHSTTTALIDVTDYLYKQRESGLLTGALFLDLKKAFDTVEPGLLLNKLSEIGIVNQELMWFKDYMSSRTQSVVLDGCMSDSMVIDYGVPQGSILGPLLFTLYINNLPSVVRHSKVVLYADDTVLFVSGDNAIDIENKLCADIQEVHKWLTQNKLTLNANKTKCMVFGNQCKLTKCKPNLNVTIGQTVLEQVQCFKYLGLYFDPCLKWTAHVDKISAKVSQRIGIMSRVGKYIPPDVTVKLYKALILPIIHYGDIIWSKGNCNNVSRVQRLQNRAGRTILKCKRRTHIECIHKKLQWLTFTQRCTMNKCIMVAKCMFNDVPTYLQNVFKPLNNIHGYNTRKSSKNGLFVPVSKSKSGHSTFAYEGTQLWNALPNDLTILQSYNHFKTKCKQYFKQQIPST
jgi:hypothetical protein